MRAVSTVRVCRWRLKTNPLCMWCYCVVVLVIQAFLLYRAITRCRHYNELRWTAANRPVGELYAFIILIVVSVTCLPFFVAASLFRVANYANDGVRLGRDCLPETDASPWTHLAWRYLGPVGCTIHVMASFALLLPHVFLQAQEIHHGLLHKDAVWLTEADGLLAERRPITIPQRRFGHPHDDVTGGNGTTLNTAMMGRLTVGLSAEFVNYCLALVFYSVRYAAVFWYTKRSFSILFSVQLLIASLHAVFSFSAMSVLYTVRLNAHLYDGLHFHTVLPHGAVMLLYLLSGAVVFLSPAAVFNYGLAQYHDALRARGGCTERARVACCHGYTPHCVATAALTLTVALRAGVVYDLVAVYRITGRRLLLAATVMDVCYMLAWIGVWTVLTVKQDWRFHVDVASLGKESVAAAAASEVAPPVSTHPEPLSPTLRKTRQRRTNPSHVTFVDAVRLGSTGRRKRDASSGGCPSSRRQRPLSDSSLDRCPPRWPEGNATPDNTLTRSYRHSVRDACGQYYRQSLEVASSPAAHSSPVPILTQRQRMTSMAHSAPAAMQQHQGHLRESLSPIESISHQTAPGVDFRRRQPAVPDSTLSDAMKPPRWRGSRDPGGRTEGLTTPTSATTTHDHHSHHQKPDLYRRDSALPSSNETSSNDSTSVLCSQV